jgi:hypothetical protein
MDYGLNRFVPENPFKMFPIPHIRLIELHWTACDHLDLLQHLWLAVAEIVDDHHTMSCRQQSDAGMRTDESGAAGDQYRLVHVSKHFDDLPLSGSCPSIASPASLCTAGD